MRPASLPASHLPPPSAWRLSPHSFSLCCPPDTPTPLTCLLLPPSATSSLPSTPPRAPNHHRPSPMCARYSKAWSIRRKKGGKTLLRLQHLEHRAHPPCSETSERKTSPGSDHEAPPPLGASGTPLLEEQGAPLS